MNLSQQIDTVQNISPKQFREEYLKPQRPLVIKGLANETPAGKTWSLDYFKTNMGECSVDLYDNRNVNSSASAFTRPDLQMKFGDYLDIIAKNERSDLRIFLFNMFKRNPQLKKDFPCPELFKGVLNHVAHMFFGGRDTSVRMHYDIDLSNVLHTHFGGKKRVILIAPEYKAHLYCLPLNTYSLVDVHNPDYKKYPALLSVKGYDLTLEHGDTLFMPSGYWHYMTYVQVGFSVSYRKMAGGLPNKLGGLTNLCLRMPLDKMLNRLLGPRWLERKKRMAGKRAYRAIEKEYRRSIPAFTGEKQDITFV